MHLLSRFLAAGALCSLPFLSAPVAAEGIDADAELVMRELSAYMASLPSLSVRYETDTEVVDIAGQKLQLTGYGELALQRPDKLYITRTSASADAELHYDGSKLVIYGVRLNAFMDLPLPEGAAPGIETAVETLRSLTGLDAPAADLFYADLYGALMVNVSSGTHVGRAMIGGVPCHHLAFRTELVDWQLWVTEGEQPLPLRYVITSKWVTGAPQYSVRFYDWEVGSQADDSLFSFAPPAGARQIDAIEANVIGELTEAE